VLEPNLNLFPIYATAAWFRHLAGPAADLQPALGGRVPFHRHILKLKLADWKQWLIAYYGGTSISRGLGARHGVENFASLANTSGPREAPRV